MRRDFSCASATYDSASDIQSRVVSELLDRCPALPAGARLLDLGSGTGAVARGIAQRGWNARIVQLDCAEAMCRMSQPHAPALCADVRALPVGTETFDAVLSSFCLQWVEPISPFFEEAARVLRPGGILHVATLGPESLPELAGAFTEAGLTARRLLPPSIVELSHQATRSGLRLLATDRFDLIATAPHPRALLRRMHGIGARDKSDSPALSTAEMRRLLAAYPQGEEGAAATYQVLMLTAGKPRSPQDPRAQEAYPSGGIPVFAGTVR